MREREHQVITKLVDALRKFSRELFVGGREREFRARMDQIGDGLGLREVNASVEKSAAGEFAGFGQPRAVGEQRVEDKLRGQNAAVTGNLHSVLAREGAWCAQDGEQHFINDLKIPLTPALYPAGGKGVKSFFIADDFAVLNRVRRRGGRFQRTFPDGQKTFVRDGECLRTGNSHDGQAAFAERRGDGSNGVVKHGGNYELRTVYVEFVFGSRGRPPHHSNMAAIARLIFPLAAFEKQPRLLVAFFVQVVEQRRVGVARKLAGRFVQAREQRQQAGFGIRRRHGLDGFSQLRERREQFIFNGVFQMRWKSLLSDKVSEFARQPRMIEINIAEQIYARDEPRHAGG